jgi:SAM-dependent methyltransferase
MTSSLWANHLLSTKDFPPSALLIEAMPAVSQRNHALDLGAGGLKDTRFLLAQGFEHVTVVDQEPTAKKLANTLANPLLEVIIGSFDEFAFPHEQYDLVNAQFALPFNPPETFYEMMEKLKTSIIPGGIFCGQLFGKEDEWNIPTSKLTFHTKEEVGTLFSGFTFITCRERIYDGILANGTPKHWHLFHIIAKKN